MSIVRRQEYARDGGMLSLSFATIQTRVIQMVSKTTAEMPSSRCEEIGHVNHQCPKSRDKVDVERPDSCGKDSVLKNPDSICSYMSSSGCAHRVSYCFHPHV